MRSADSAADNPYARSYGYKYDEGGKMDTAAIAKLIRRDIKTAIRERPIARTACG